MQTNKAKKTWSRPTITAVEQLKQAAGGTNTNLSKSATDTEFIYQGPGS